MKKSVHDPDLPIGRLTRVKDILPPPAQIVTRKGMAIRIIKTCAVCGRHMKVYAYPTGRYRGGHYFMTIPWKGKRVEYWECPTCYRTPDPRVSNKSTRN